MKYKVSYDEEAGTLNIKTFAPLMADDARDITSLAEAILEGKEHRYVLVDLSEGSSDMADKETRQAFRKYAKPGKYEKVAVFGANPAVRMVSKIILAITGVSKITQFFKTEEEAVIWLKGENR